jgi:hypothetical protein
MPPETEVIKQQMGQTRASLTEKLETLENQVLGTVQDTTSTVSGTVHDVRATVRDTMQDMRATVCETVATVRDAFDVPRQMQNHPWVLLGGAVVAGYVGGRVLESIEEGRFPPRIAFSGATDPLASERLVAEPARAVAPAAPRLPSFLKSLADTFAPELAKLKGVALGMAMGVVRDKLSQSIPPQYQGDLTEMMNRLTVTLGGEPTPPGSGVLGRDESEEYDGSGRVRAMDL